MVVGYLLLTAAFYWMMSSTQPSFPLLFVFILGYGFLLYFLYFWIAVYFVVELALWRRTRNRGHLLQFLGALLILAPITWNIAATSAMNLEMMFSPVGIALVLIGILALGTGIVFAMLGYTHRSYHANDVDLYRNVVVRAGERIGLLTDGYSTRVFETKYEDFPGEAVQARADEYAVRFQRAGFFLFHRMDATGVTLYPVAYTGVSGLRIATAFAHLYRLWRHPDRLTWVRVEWTGEVKVHISPEDYRRIKRPVAHHVLCAGVADSVVGSLLAYVAGREGVAVRGLLGPEPVLRPADLRLPEARGGLASWAVVGIAAALLVAGTGASLAVGFLRPPPPSLSIQDVRWSPVHPVGGQSINVFANLSGPTDFFASMVQFSLLIWAYYNDSLFGARYFNNIEGDLYGAWLGSYPNGTEVTFMVQGYATTTQAGTVYATSPPYVVDVGTVHQGGPSGLSIRGPNLQADALGGGRFSAWINSTAPIDTAQILFTGYYTATDSQGTVSGGTQVIAMNLTGSLSLYAYSAPGGALGPLTAEHIHAVIWYKFIARDTTWNTAATPMLTFEVDR